MVVVGAGMAGLTAAASLIDAGFEVVLLEASNYIGRFMCPVGSHRSLLWV